MSNNWLTQFNPNGVQGFDWTAAATQGMDMGSMSGMGQISPAGINQQGGWLDSLLGGNDFSTPAQNGGFMGNLATGLNTFANVANSWLGYQQYQQAKDQFRFNKALTETNLANQAKTVNQRIADRHNARKAYSSDTYQQSTEQVLSQFGVSGKVGG